MFKSIINYIKYRKFIEQNKDYLTNEFNIKIDRLYRLGSRVSIPERRYEILLNYKNSQLDIFKNLDLETKKYISKLDRYFMQKNMSEFVGILNAERTDVNEVTVIISYKFFNVVKLANIGRITFLISLLSLISGFLDLNYMIPGIVLIFLYFSTNILLFKKLFV
jgi:hypothetical protein